MKCLLTVIETFSEKLKKIYYQGSICKIFFGNSCSAYQTLERAPDPPRNVKIWSEHPQLARYTRFKIQFSITRNRKISENWKKFYYRE